MANVKPVHVSILDKEYTVACEDGERESLHAAVDFLNQRMASLRDGGKIIGNERIAVMAALNITHEFLAYKSENASSASNVNAGILRIQEKIRDALETRQRVSEIEVPESSS